MPREQQEERRRQVRTGFEKRYHDLAERFRGKLTDFYGPEKGGSIKHAEAFEVARDRAVAGVAPGGQGQAEATV